MLGEDGGGGSEVGDGTGDFDDTGIGAGGKAEAVDKRLEKIAAGGVQRAEAFKLLRTHLCVGKNGGPGEAVMLHLPGAEDPRRHRRGRLRLLPPHELSGLDRSHKKLKIKPVH